MAYGPWCRQLPIFHKPSAWSHQPWQLSLVRDHFLGPPGRAPENDAALRRADEVDQVLDLFAGERLILLDLLQCARRVQLRLEQVAERSPHLRDHVRRESAAHEADGVRAVDPR